MKSSRSIQLARERHLAATQLRLTRMVGGVEPLVLTHRIVVDHDLERIEHAEAARSSLVEVLADAAFE
jgi:hypothetical protein